MSQRLVYWRRSREVLSPFVTIVIFVLVTNVLLIIRWTTTADDSLPKNPDHMDAVLTWISEPLSRRRLKLPAASKEEAILANTSKSDPLYFNFSGLVPRAFESSSIPCFPAEHRWWGQNVLTATTTTGFLFNKPFKTASSTAVGVHLRIAVNLAKRQFASQNVAIGGASTASRSTSDYSICQTRFDHGLGRNLFPHRDKKRSFLWTTLRDPTKRAISMFFHFMVARHKIEPTDENFQASIERGAVMVRDYYLYILSTSGYTSRQRDDPLLSAKAILHDEYDFIAITERMDESLVALQLLAGLSTADILYIDAKHHGHFDDGAGKKRCFYIWPSFVTPGMQAYFDSEHWHNMIQWDLALYQAANRSLDMTIEKLGSSMFDAALMRFQTAQRVALERCQERAIFPCSSGGIWRSINETNCIWNDSGCGNACLDQIADELGLWDYAQLISKN